MLFDNRYNGLIEMLEDLNGDFANYYEIFFESLPYSIVRKCRKMETFEVSKGNKNYILDGVYDEEVEFIVEEDGKILSSLNIYRMKKEKIDGMEKKESDGIPKSLDDKSIVELCMFETRTDEGHRIGFSFVINKRNNGLYILKNVVSDNSRLNCKKAIRINEKDLLTTPNNRR